MKCNKTEQLALLVFYGEATPGEQRRLDNHMRHCLDCAAKVRKMREELTEMKKNISEVPDFSRVDPWEKINTVLKREEFKHNMKPRFFPDVSLKAALIIAVFCLGIFAGKLIFYPAPSGISGEDDFSSNISGILEKHLGSVRISLMEFLNFHDMKDQYSLWLFEKKQTEKLLFQNRLLLSYLKDSTNPPLIDLLEDLDLILQEIANLSPDKPEYLSFIKSLLKDTDIIFRVNHFRSDEKEILL